MDICCRHPDRWHNAFTGECAIELCHGPVSRVDHDPVLPGHTMSTRELHEALRQLRAEGHTIEVRRLPAHQTWQYRLVEELDA